MTDNGITLLTEKVKSQISGFNNRRKRVQRSANLLTNGYLFGGPLSVLAISLNLKYPETYWGVIALVFSTITVICLQTLKQFKFQERLRIAILTHANLRKLESRIEFELAQNHSGFDPKEYYQEFEDILETSNSSWNDHFTKSISETRKVVAEQVEI